MAKSDVVEAALVSMQKAQQQAAIDALGSTYDSGYSDGSGGVVAPPDTTPFSQADIDAAVETATTPLRNQIANMQLEQAQKDALEEGIADQMQSLQNAIRALTTPAQA